MRRTRLVCTIGPASDSRESIGRLIDAGMDVARLNFSHGTQDQHGAVINLIREASRDLDHPVAILQDLAGPKIRTGPLANGPATLVPGRSFTLTTLDVPGDAGEVSITYAGLPGDVDSGDTILLGDGAIELAVERVSGTAIDCTVVVGGVLGARKGINLPERSMSASAFSEKDRLDLAFGIAAGVDYVALSFVKSARDIRVVREAMGDASDRIPVIAKIEKREALDELDGILAEVDGVMVARGDLGVEVPIEQVPGIQKIIIEKANRAAKPVITATQMLMSMQMSPRPTRAEVTDVANAILDGSDAVMLSEETAIGSYAVKAVEMMSRIATSAEESIPHARWLSMYDKESGLTPEESVARAACSMARELDATAIITFTYTGSTTRLVARHRPAQPVIAPTPRLETYRQLAMVWGTVPIMAEAADSDAAIEERVVHLALETGLVRKGERLVITAGLPLYVPGTTNLIKVVTA